MARHSGGDMVALLSDITDWLSVTAIPVVPMAALTCSGLSNKPGSSRSTSGRGIIGRVGVANSAFPVTTHPAVRTHTAAAGSATADRRIQTSPFEPSPTSAPDATPPSGPVENGAAIPPTHTEN